MPIKWFVHHQIYNRIVGLVANVLTPKNLEVHFQNLIEKFWWCGEGDIHGNKEYSIASCIKYDLLEVISHCNSYRLFAGFDSSYSWKIVNSSNKNNFSTSTYQHYNCIFWTNEGLVLTYLQHNLWLQRQQNQQLEH